MLAACTTPHTCSLVGATSGVTFDLSQLLENQSGKVHVRACVEQTCVKHVASSGRWNLVPVNDPALTGPRSVEAHLVVTHIVTDNGRSTFDQTISLQLHKLQPNGPDCPPTAFAAAVALDSDGNLVQQPRP